MIPPVVASDRGRAQTAAVFGQGRGCRNAMMACDDERNRRGGGDARDSAQKRHVIHEGFRSSPCLRHEGD